TTRRHKGTRRPAPKSHLMPAFFVFFCATVSLRGLGCGPIAGLISGDPNPNLEPSRAATEPAPRTEGPARYCLVLGPLAANDCMKLLVGEAVVLLGGSGLRLVDLLRCKAVPVLLAQRRGGLGKACSVGGRLELLPDIRVFA